MGEAVAVVVASGNKDGGADVRATTAHATAADTSTAATPMRSGHGMTLRGGRTLSIATRISASVGGSSSSAMR